MQSGDRVCCFRLARRNKAANRQAVVAIPCVDLIHDVTSEVQAVRVADIVDGRGPVGSVVNVAVVVGTVEAVTEDVAAIDEIRRGTHQVLRRGS